MLEVYGASDDLIEIKGDIHEEFNYYGASNGEPEPFFLAFSDGTILRVVYDGDALWRLTLIFKGSLYKEKIEGNVEEDKNDIVRFNDGVKWVVGGTYFAK